MAIVGTQGNDLFQGIQGNDLTEGLGCGDLLNGGLGRRDRLYGGSGDDRLTGSGVLMI